jgi:thiol-disulfide isomerase/thioredoxin
MILLVFIVSCGNNTQKEEPKNLIKIETVGIDGYEKLKYENKDKVIIMNFFAPWCGPCNQEAPEFVNAYKNLKSKGLEIIALAVDTSEAEVNNFINKHNINFKVYIADKELQRKFGISSIPTNIFYAPKNKLLAVRVGAISERAITEIVENYSK